MSPPFPSRGRRLAAVLLALLATALTGCGGEPSPRAPGDPLRVALVPNQNPEKVKAEYGPLGEYLSRELGTPVELDVPSGYPAVVEAMANDRIDLALFGGLTYVQARERTRVTPLVTDVTPETHTTRYHSTIIVPGDSPVRRVDEMRGKNFAFGSVSSTSGSLYPALMLRAAGIDFRSDLDRFTYTSGHDATAAAVASGRVDGGGIEQRILRRLIADGTIERGAVRQIEVSEEIEGYPWVASDALDPATRDRITRAFLDIRDPKLLDLLNAEGYERVDAGDYDVVERNARELELLAPSS